MMRGARVPDWLLIAAAELHLLRRSPFALIMAAVLPTALGLLIVWAERDTGRAGWGAAAGLLLVTLMAFTAYVAGTTTLVARRQQFVLKHLRTSAASDSAIVAGVLTPLALLTIVQTVVLLSIVAVADGLHPFRPGLLLLVIGAGTLVACTLAAVTATFTSTPELAQFTTSPVTLAFFGGALWAVRTPPGDVTWAMLALPGASVAQLARAVWREPGVAGVTGAVTALLLLAGVAMPLAIRFFIWEPRR
jgi:ABC-2 type transport system permease protein